MGRRRTPRVDQSLRNLLLAEHRRNVGPGSRWYRPGAGPSEYEQALVAGEPVVVDSSGLLCALMYAGHNADDYAFGGRHWGKQWLLDTDGTLTEYVEGVS